MSHSSPITIMILKCGCCNDRLIFRPVGQFSPGECTLVYDERHRGYYCKSLGTVCPTCGNMTCYSCMDNVAGLFVPVCRACQN